MPHFCPNTSLSVLPPSFNSLWYTSMNNWRSRYGTKNTFLADRSPRISHHDPTTAWGRDTHGWTGFVPGEACILITSCTFSWEYSGSGLLYCLFTMPLGNCELAAAARFCCVCWICCKVPVTWRAETELPATRGMERMVRKCFKNWHWKNEGI